MDYSSNLVPNEINYIWLGRTFIHFNQSRIQECAAKNPDYKIFLWIDDLSMLDREQIQNLSTVIPEKELQSYTDYMDKRVPANPDEADDVLKLSLSIQEEYHDFLSTNPQFQRSIPTVRDFQRFVDSTGRENIKLRYTSTKFYPTLISEARKAAQERQKKGGTGLQTKAGRQKEPELRLLEWAFLERLRGNYAAASNLLRIQYLQIFPGIYIDHDDSAPAFGQLHGFKYTRSADYLPTNSFLASPSGHPFLQFLRYKVLDGYNALRDKKILLSYMNMEKPNNVEELDHPYIIDTYTRSGPGALVNAFRYVDDMAPLSSLHLEIRKGWLRDVTVHPRHIKTWALKRL